MGVLTKCIGRPSTLRGIETTNVVDSVIAGICVSEGLPPFGVLKHKLISALIKASIIVSEGLPPFGVLKLALLIFRYRWLRLLVIEGLPPFGVLKPNPSSSAMRCCNLCNRRPSTLRGIETQCCTERHRPQSCSIGRPSTLRGIETSLSCPDSGLVLFVSEGLPPFGVLKQVFHVLIAG